jgi:hypothetical protein
MLHGTAGQPARVRLGTADMIRGVLVDEVGAHNNMGVPSPPS